MEIIGRDIEVGIATEATRGTAESSADKWVKKNTVTILERASHADNDVTHGRLEDMQGRRVTQKYIQGNLEGIAHVDMLGYIYASLYGKVASAVVSGSVYDHEFTLQQDIEHQSLTVFAKDGTTQQLKFNGCMVETFELTAGVDDFVRYTASFLGKSGEDDTDTPSYDEEYDFIGRDITVKIADSEGGLSGASALKAKEITVRHDAGSIRDHVLGSYNPDDNYNSKKMIEGELTLNFTDETLKDLYLGDNSKYMQVTIQGEADLGGGNNPTITYLFNNVQVTSWERNDSIDELVTETVTFRAFYNRSDAQQSKVTLRNLTSSYANVPSN